MTTIYGSWVMVWRVDEYNEVFENPPELIQKPF